MIELLVVIAIIGLLSTLAVVALGSARAKGRDARRLSDVKQYQLALEIFYADQGYYPGQASGGEIALGTDAAACLSNQGFKTTCVAAEDTEIYIKSVQAAPTPPSDSTYSYGAVDEDDVDCTSLCDSYTITFTLESPTQGLNEGSVIATPEGISNAPTE